MDCAEEVSLLRRALGEMPGVLDLRFDVVNARMSVEFDPAQLDSERIARAVAGIGLKCEPFRELAGTEPWWLRNGRAILTSVSGLALLAGALFQAESAD